MLAFDDLLGFDCVRSLGHDFDLKTWSMLRTRPGRLSTVSASLLPLYRPLVDFLSQEGSPPRLLLPDVSWHSDPATYKSSVLGSGSGDEMG